MNEIDLKKWLSIKLKMYDKTWIGVLSGFLFPLLTLFITYLYKFESYSLTEFFQFLIRFRVLTKLLALCVLPNLGLFFLSLYPNLLRVARGILTSTFITAIIIIIIQVLLGNF